MTSLRTYCRLSILFVATLFTVYVIVINTLSLRRHYRNGGGSDPLSSSGTLVVPNIVHFAWFNPSKPVFRFHHYLSLLSAYKRLKPEKIYFWHDSKPAGPWWFRIREHCRITMKFREAPKTIFNKTIKVPEHRSDIVRLQVLREYGGIYLDLDVIVLKSFDPLRQYDVTLGREPSGLCNGIIISKPKSEFLKLWFESYRDFDDSLWSRHSVQRPYELAKLYPGLIHVEETALNYPGWTELDLIYGKKPYDWSQNYAIHLWYRFHDREYNPQTIRDLKSTLGEVLRWTYYDDKKLLERQ